MNSFFARCAIQGLWVVLLAHTIAGVAHEKEGIEGRYAEFRESENQTFRPGISSRVRGEIISDRFVQLGFVDALEAASELSEDELDLLFNAAELVFFYRPTSDSFRYLESIISEFSARELLTERHLTLRFESLLVLRRFSDAAGILAEYPELKHFSVPEISEGVDGPESGRDLLVFNAEAQSLIKRKVAMVDGIVAVMQPQGCPFSRGALNEIEANSNLKDGFEEYGLFLLPHFFPVHGGYLSSLSNEFESTLAVPFDLAQWQEIEDWAVPTFYVYENGEVVETLEGWTEASRSRIVRYFRKWNAYQD